MKVNYFSHDYYARNDLSMKKLFMGEGLAGIGLYWCLIEMLYEKGGFIDNEYIPIIAYDMRTTDDTVKSVITKYGLFNQTKTNFFSDSVLKRLEIRGEKSKMAKCSADTRWENNANAMQTQCKRNANAMQTQCKRNANAMQTQCKRNAIKEKERKEKERKESNNAPTHEKPTFHKHGKYGWVLLTAEQYARLVEEFTDDYITKAINGLDEYIQGNGNKNKYKDWNIVLRKAIREKWDCVKGISKERTSQASNFAERNYSAEVMADMFKDIHRVDDINV